MLNTQKDSGNFSIKQSIKKLQTLISNSIGIKSSSHLHHVIVNNNNDHQNLINQLPLYKEISIHLENIRLTIEKKALIISKENSNNLNNNLNNNSNSSNNLNNNVNNNSTDTNIKTSPTCYRNSTLKKSKRIQQLSEICTSLFLWMKNDKKIRFELIDQALNDTNDQEERYLILIIESLDAIMTHVLRQFLSRKERKAGKTDVGKKALIYKKLEQDANEVILELFVFSLSVGCLDSKELFVIEHVSENLERKLQQQFWNNTLKKESISSLGGVFLCALINKNVGPHHILWNHFIESVQIGLKGMSTEMPGRDRLLKSLYNIHINVSHNKTQIVDIYKWATVSAALGCIDSKYLPKEITNYLLDQDILNMEEENCKYLSTRFILKELRKIHIPPSSLLSYHIQNFEVANDLLKFLDDIIVNRNVHYEKLRKICSEETVFISCLMIRFFLLRRRSGFSKDFYHLAQKFELLETIFEIILEYLVEKKNSFKSTYAYGLLRDLLYLIALTSGETKFDPIAERMTLAGEELLQSGITPLDTDSNGLKTWADRLFNILLSQKLYNVYPHLLRKCLSSMLCKLCNSSENVYTKAALIDIVGHFHNIFFLTNSFMKLKRDHNMNRSLMTLVRFSAFIFLKIQPSHSDELTKFYVEVANLYSNMASEFACRFSFLDSFYFDEMSQTFKVFAIEECVLENQSKLMLECQQGGHLTDLLIIFQEEQQESSSSDIIEIIEE